MTTSPVLSQDQYVRFHALVLESTGIELPESRRVDLEREVLRSLDETGAKGTDALYRLLREGPSGRRALEALVGRLTVGETYFFRNRPQFDALERQVLPELIERRREARRLRLWSAGCSTGEEAYSLAILLRRLLPDIDDWHVTIMGTDIDRAALEEARGGVYRTWSFRDVPEQIRSVWFEERKGRFEVRPALRDLVTFDYLNLAEDVYPSLHTNTHAMDLILCRNVLMYLREQETRRVVARLRDALSEGGWLVVGHTDPSQTLFREFEVHNLPGTVLYRKRDIRDSEASDERARDGEPRAPVFLPEPSIPASPAVAKPRHSAAVARASVRERTGERIDVIRAEALALFEAGRFDEAGRLLEEVAGADSGDAEAPYLLAKIAANRLDIEAAERWIDVALGRSPVHAPTHYLRGLLHQEDGRFEAALDLYRRCVYADPSFVLGHFALAGVLGRVGQPKRARKSLENVTGLLAGRERDEQVAEGDGMTVGRLLELASVHRGFLEQDMAG
jgi:chemotaxis protein methyltransferase CheR